jgi:multidrug efflux system membrane fusion protein
VAVQWQVYNRTKEHMSIEVTTNKESNALAPKAPPPEVTTKGKSRAWLWVLILILLAGGAYYLSRGGAGQSLNKTGKQDGKQGRGSSVPVVTVAARKGNMEIFLEGLGTVTALNTVTVRTRVDGQLDKVAFTEGQVVQRGELLAQIDPRPYQVQLEQAEGQMARDEAMLKNARLDLERYRILLEQDSVPKQQYDTQVATVNQAEGTVKSDQAQIDNAKLQLVYCKITSPLGGRIGLRLVDQGNMVHASDANGLAVITQIQPIAVVFNITDSDVPQVLQKMRGGAQLRVDAYDKAMTKKIATGQLLTIDNQIDMTTGTLRFKAIFGNADGALFPNQFVNARLLIDTRRNTVIIPEAAVQRKPQGVFTYVVKSDNTVEERDIVLGPVESDERALESGVVPGEAVVVEGVDKLQPGSKVTPRAAGAPARPVGAGRSSRAQAGQGNAPGKALGASGKNGTGK